MELIIGGRDDIGDLLRRAPDYGSDKTVCVYQASVAHRAFHHTELGDTDDETREVFIPAETNIRISKPEVYEVDYNRGKISVQLLIQTTGRQDNDRVDDELRLYLVLMPDGLRAHGMRKGPYSDGFADLIGFDRTADFKTFPEVMEAIAEYAVDYPGLDFGKIAYVIHDVLRDFLNHPTLVQLETQTAIRGASSRAQNLRDAIAEAGVAMAQKLIEEDKRALANMTRTEEPGAD